MKQINGCFKSFYTCIFIQYALMITLVGELREESRDGVDAELAL